MAIGNLCLSFDDVETRLWVKPFSFASPIAERHYFVCTADDSYCDLNVIIRNWLLQKFELKQQVARSRELLKRCLRPQNNKNRLFIKIDIFQYII